MQNESPTAASDDLVLEGVVVTLAADGTPNIAPMGPRVDRNISRLVLRPYPTSQTYANLKQTGCGVFHVTDDVMLMAQAAVGRLQPLPALTRIDGFDCPRLADACRWFAFKVLAVDESDARVAIQCDISVSGEIRPFFGFNRAKHAVVEASILATRVGMLAGGEIRSEMQRLAVIVQKTAGLQERNAFKFLEEHIAFRLNDDT
jgi:hypothetical protein